MTDPMTDERLEFFRGYAKTMPETKDLVAEVDRLRAVDKGRDDMTRRFGVAAQELGEAEQEISRLDEERSGLVAKLAPLQKLADDALTFQSRNPHAIYVGDVSQFMSKLAKLGSKEKP